MTRSGIVGPLAAVVLSLAAMAQAMRIWEWAPGTPLGLDGDAASVTTWSRTVIEYGAYSDNPDLGAPFGQNLGWFPTADDIHFLFLQGIALFTQSAFTVTAIYFFLCFPLSALTMYWLARTERISVPVAVVVGVLFSVVPGHQTRFVHMFLAAYWAVPLGIWLVLRVARGRRVFVLRRGRRASMLNLRTLALVIVVSLTGVYHTAFVLLLIASAALIRLVVRYRRWELYRALGLLVLIGGITTTSLALMFLRTRGDVATGPAASLRSPAESEAFGGKIVDLVLPWSQHRVDALAKLTQNYDAATSTTFEVSALGVVALTGCVLACLMALGPVLTGMSRGRTRTALGIYGLLIILATAFYTKAGVGALFALFVLPEIRTWSRFFLLIALFGLLAVGRLTDQLRARRGRIVGGLAAALILVIGVLDQTNPGAAPPYAQNRARLESLTSLTGALESRLEPGCPIFQLPVIAFPGSRGVHDIHDYDLFWPYLASSSRLSWSYGAITGTSRADWQFALPRGDVRELSDDLAAAGFCAVTIDTAGYVDPAPTIAQFEQQLSDPVARTGDGRTVAFDLRPRRSTLESGNGASAVQARRDRVLHPVVAFVPTIADPPESADTPDPGRFQLSQTGDITVANMGATATSVTLSMQVSAPDGTARQVVVDPQGAPSTSTPYSSSAPATVTVTVVVPPGRSTVRLTAKGPDPTEREAAWMLLSNVTATDAHGRVIVAPSPR